MSSGVTEHLKHLRSVHLAIIATCFTLLVALSVKDEREIDIALRQLEQIISIKELVGAEDLAKAQDNTNQWIGDTMFHSIPIKQRMKLDSIYSLMAVVSESYGREKKLHLAYYLENVLPDPLRLSMWNLKSTEFESLGTFKQMWEEWEQVEVIVPDEVEPNSFMGALPGSLDEIDSLVIVSSRHQYVEDHSSCEWFSHSELVLLDSTDSRNIISGELIFGCDDGPSRGLIVDFGHQEHIIQCSITIRFSKVSVYLQQAILDRLRLYNQVGRFENSFAELNTVARYSMSTDLNDLHNDLEAEKGRTGESLNLFGAKVPDSELLRLVFPVIVVLQFYFTLHLSRIVSLGAQIPEFPWIALYTQPHSKAATLATIVVATPLVFIIYVVTTGLQWDFELIYELPIALLMFWSSYWCWKQLAVLWQKLASQTSEADDQETSSAST